MFQGSTDQQDVVFSQNGGKKDAAPCIFYIFRI